MSEWHPAECNRTGHQGRFLDFVQAAPCATNCVSACCNCVRAASAATVAPTCGSASLSVKIASAARPGGVNIPKSPHTHRFCSIPAGTGLERRQRADVV